MPSDLRDARTRAAVVVVVDFVSGDEQSRSRDHRTPLLVAAVVALGVSTLLGRYWFLENGLEQIDWRTIGILWAYCFVWFLIQDIVKVLFYKFLDFCYWMQAKRASRTKSMPPSSSGLPIAEKPFDAADALVKIARMEENIALLRREVLVHAAKQAEQSGG